MAAQRKRRRARGKKAAPGAQPAKPPELGTQSWLYNRAADATEKVAKRLTKELGKTPLIEFLFQHFGSLLFFAAQRLIDLRTKTGKRRPQDEAVILSCSRLFNECFSGYSLVRRGLMLQAIVLLRSTFEVTSQAILFMEREDMASRWLQGRRIAPKEVRAKSQFAGAHKELYDRLAGLSHANLEAAYYHTAPVAGHAYVGLAYGGWFAPKTAGQIAIQFLFAQLVFLETFYAVYESDLAQHDLLWMPATAKSVEDIGGKAPIAWADILGTWRKALTDLSADYNRMPDDTRELSKYLAELMEKTPTLKNDVAT